KNMHPSSNENRSFLNNLRHLELIKRSSSKESNFDKISRKIWEFTLKSNVETNVTPDETRKFLVKYCSKLIKESKSNKVFDKDNWLKKFQVVFTALTDLGVNASLQEVLNI
ncbi:MAG: hypothetical protein MHPSP_003293, partial [Paramarteilia canceri]